MEERLRPSAYINAVLYTRPTQDPTAKCVPLLARRVKAADRLAAQRTGLSERARNERARNIHYRRPRRGLADGGARRPSSPTRAAAPAARRGSHAPDERSYSASPLTDAPEIVNSPPTYSELPSTSNARTSVPLT